MTANSDKFVDLRRRAEEALRKQAIEPRQLSAEDIQSLMYELQLYQLQLEMQDEELRQTQQELAAWRNKYSDLYDFAPIGYFSVGEQGLILEANLTGAKLLGTVSNDLINKPFAHFVTRDSQDQYFVHRQQVFEMKTSQVCELKLVKKDGQPFYAQLQSIVVPDKDGNFNQFHTSVMDITEHRQARERLRQQEKMAAVGQLAEGIAHDFNNILQAITGTAQLLGHTHSDLPADVQQGLRHINQQGQQAAQLVRQLLDFSHRSLSRQQPLSLVPFLQELLKLLERTIPEKIRLRLNYSPGPYWVKADVVQLEQALLNLAVNARDAMPEGGELDLALSRQHLAEGEPAPVSKMPSGEWIVMSVTDTGIGIPEHILPHVFEPFFTTKSTGEGAGLGLAQVYGIVRQHVGYINVTSRVGQGTTFTLYLPALPLPTQPLPEATETNTPYGRGETVLLVEDEVAVLETVQGMLEYLGYRVLTATNGQEALAIYDQHPAEISLVLTDVTMPEMSGPTLARILWQRNPTLKMILLTGYSLEAEEKEMPPLAMADRLQKPLDIEQLAQTVSRLLK